MAGLVLLLALLIDRYGGEPATRWHPVGWMGHYLGWVKARRPTRRPLFAGTGWLLLGAAGVVIVALLLQTGLAGLPGEPLLIALLLKPLFSVAALLDASREVERALRAGARSEARRRLSWHLVSRDTRDLSDTEVAGATVASLAENTSDSIVAPFVYFALFGLPGAALYRFVNTADAVLGYRTAGLEHYGKAAARSDDLLNLLPARLSAFLFVLVAPAASRHRAWSVMWRDAKHTPSPNGGWPMAAAAGGLNVCLDKRSVYTLNAAGRAATVDDIVTMRQMVRRVTVLSATLVAVWGGVRAYT